MEENCLSDRQVEGNYHPISGIFKRVSKGMQDTLHQNYAKIV